MLVKWLQLQHYSIRPVSVCAAAGPTAQGSLEAAEDAWFRD